MLSKGIETMEQMPWLEYATYDEDGFVNGVRDDIPDNIKKLYEKSQKEMQSIIANSKMTAK